jgi:hypothetical protein
LFWLVVTPIPAAITRDLIAPIRAANLIFPLVILSAIGTNFLLDKIKNIAKWQYLPLIGLIILILWNFIYFLDAYFVHYQKIASKNWLYGHKQAVNKISQKYDQIDQVVFTTAYNEPYIFTLFYTKYPPQNYQPQAKLELVRGSLDVGEVPGYDKFQFRSIYWPHDRDAKNTLFIGTSEELPQKDLERDLRLGKVTSVEEIKFLDNDTAFKIVLTK